MTARTPRPDDLDLLLTAWLDSDAHVKQPDRLLTGVLERTSRSRPLPAWRLPERWLPMQLALRAQPRTRLVPFLVVLALIVAALVAVALLAGTRRHVPPPFGLAANGQIAFVRDGQLVTENPNGSGIHAMLQQISGQQASPTFSRDGTKIVYKDVLGTTDANGYTQRVDVVVADPDGSHPVTVAHDVVAGNPIWSPDGRRLVWSGPGDHAFVAAADGSGITDIGKIGAGAWTPSWAPDSEHLAVAAADGVLWVVNRDGTDAHRISHGDYAEVGEKGWSADWSPDGTKLLFGAPKAGQDYGLYVVGLDGAPERLISPCANNGVWSPDGSLFAYMRCGTGVGPSVVVSDIDGHRTRVLDGYYGWYMPAWSPDQTRIAILDDRPGTANQPGPPVIVLLDPLGKAPSITLPAGSTALTEDTSPDYTLTWQRLAP